METFENLDELETFGFRGEALSSLCALADVHVVTATREEAPMAAKLDFDHHGEIVSKKVASAKVPYTPLPTNLADSSVVQLYQLQTCFQLSLSDEKNFPRTVSENSRKR